MKKKILILFAIVISISINANAQLDGKKYKGKIEGIGTLKFTLKTETYELHNSKDEMMVTGDYKLSGDTISFNDKKGMIACPFDKTGKYKFKIENNTLTFELLNDACFGRRGIASSKWIELTK